MHSYVYNHDNVHMVTIKNETKKQHFKLPTIQLNMIELAKL